MFTSTSLTRSRSSASVGFRPSSRMTLPSSSAVISPAPGTRQQYKRRGDGESDGAEPHQCHPCPALQAQPQETGVSQCDQYWVEACSNLRSRDFGKRALDVQRSQRPACTGQSGPVVGCVRPRSPKLSVIGRSVIRQRGHGHGEEVMGSDSEGTGSEFNTHHRV